MVGRRDDDRVDVLLLLEHFPVVAVALHLREVFRDDAFERRDSIEAVLARRGVGDLRETPLFARQVVGQRAPRLPCVIPVHVAQRDDVVLDAEVEQVDLAHPADADASDVEAIARRGQAAAQHVPWHDGESRAGGRECLDEIASRRHERVLSTTSRAAQAGRLNRFVFLCPDANTAEARVQAVIQSPARETHADHQESSHLRRVCHRLGGGRRHGRQGAHRGWRRRRDARSRSDLGYTERLEDAGVAVRLAAPGRRDAGPAVRRVRRQPGRLDARRRALHDGRHRPVLLVPEPDAGRPHQSLGPDLAALRSRRLPPEEPRRPRRRLADHLRRPEAGTTTRSTPWSASSGRRKACPTSRTACSSRRRGHDATSC